MGGGAFGSSLLLQVAAFCLRQPKNTARCSFLSASAEPKKRNTPTRLSGQPRQDAPGTQEAARARRAGSTRQARRKDAPGAQRRTRQARREVAPGAQTCAPGAQTIRARCAFINASGAQYSAKRSAGCAMRAAHDRFSAWQRTPCGRVSGRAAIMHGFHISFTRQRCN